MYLPVIYSLFACSFTSLKAVALKKRRPRMGYISAGSSDSDSNMLYKVFPCLYSQANIAQCHEVHINVMATSLHRQF